jgi:hypothetical protein
MPEKILVSSQKKGFVVSKYAFGAFLNNSFP